MGRMQAGPCLSAPPHLTVVFLYLPMLVQGVRGGTQGAFLNGQGALHHGTLHGLGWSAPLGPGIAPNYVPLRLLLLVACLTVMQMAPGSLPQAEVTQLIILNLLCDAHG